MVSDLDRNNLATVKCAKSPFINARLFFDLPKAPQCRAICIKNGEGIALSRQRFLPRSQERIG
jgi:hypothetical protein